MSSLALSQIVDRSQDMSAVKAFFEEYQWLLREAKEQERSLRLVDVLEQLNFLDAGILPQANAASTYSALKRTLNSHRVNMLIEAPPGDFVPADVQTNLFKILCAVQNLRPNQRGSLRFDDATLEQLTSQTFKHNPNSEDNIFQQVLIIQNLIDRPAYTMTGAQIYTIHCTFRNWSEHR